MIGCDAPVPHPQRMFTLSAAIFRDYGCPERDPAGPDQCSCSFVRYDTARISFEEIALAHIGWGGGLDQ
jgi:hypothetical protein